MRFLFCEGRWVYALPGSDEIRIASARGVAWRYVDGVLTGVEHLCENIVGHGEYGGRHVVGYGPWGSMGHSWAHVRDGAIVFRDGEGTVAVPSVVGRCFTYACQRRGARYMTFIRGYEKDRDEKVVIHDAGTGEDIALDCTGATPFFIDDDAILLSEDIDQRLRCIDLGGETRWEVGYPGDRPQVRAGNAAWGPKVVEGRVFVNACSQSGPGNVLEKGEVYAIELGDGTLAWQRRFDYQVEDLRVLDDSRLVAFSDTRLMVLDMASGETLEEVETGLARQMQSVILAPIAGYVVLLSHESQRILVFDAATLDLVRDEDVAERRWRFPYEPAEVGGKLFVQVSYDRALRGLLIIDPAHIDQPLDVEGDLGFEVQIPDGEPGPIELTVDHDSLDDVLRLGEQLAMNAVYTNGDRGLGARGNEAFDGRVVMRCSGLAVAREHAVEQLEILKRRLEHYAAEEFHARSGTGEQPVTFEYEVV